MIFLNSFILTEERNSLVQIILEGIMGIFWDTTEISTAFYSQTQAIVEKINTVVAQMLRCT